MNTDKDSMYLKKLILEGENLLVQENRFYTKGNKLALEDMIQKAKQALEGKGQVPFSRCREFVKAEEAKEVLFAARRYTMAPTYLEKGSVFGRYGLEEALSWFRSRDIRNEREATLEENCAEALKQGAQLLEEAVCGTNIGQYNQECRQKLIEKMGRLTGDKGSREELCVSLVECLDAIRELRMSRILRSEQEPEAVFLLSDMELAELKNKVCRDIIAKEQYSAIRQCAGEETLAQSRLAYECMDREDEYSLLNEHFVIWGDTGKVVNFVTPKGTKGAKLYFRLPSLENEKSGLGHVWIDDVKIECADGPAVAIRNAGFEEIAAFGGGAAGWKLVKAMGNPVMYVESQEKWGGRCIYLSNRDEKDESLLMYDGVLDMKEKSGYTLYFRGKADGKFVKGLEAVLEFVDEEGSKIGEFIHYFNKKSYISAGRKALTMQCNAIVYALDGDKEMAEKAKYNMLFFLNDFCQGAEHWLLFNSRPEGCDAYGAVQAGRILCAAASTYSLIQGANVFDNNEKERFYQMTDYLIRYCLDMRDRTELGMERVQRNTSNWQTDMCIGTAAMMMVLKDFPNRKTWLYNAQAVLRAQLEVNLNADSSWPESIRYHHAALEHFSTFAAAWEKETGEDYFQVTRLMNMFAYTIHTITPPYVYFGNRIGTPPFGDHILQDGRELHIYGLYLQKVASLNKKLADDMYTVWRMAGTPVKSFSGEAVMIENLLYTQQEQYHVSEEHHFILTSNVEYPHSGIYIFRSAPVNGKQNYLAVMSSPESIGHGHFDQGTFILYKDNIPVIMDSGVEGYFDASTHWHLSSYSHACMQFATKQTSVQTAGDGFINLTAGTYSLERGFTDVPRKSKVIEVRQGTETEQIKIEIANPEGDGIHVREIEFHKTSGCVTIKDMVREFEGDILFSIPMVMREASMIENVVKAKGYYGVDMEVKFLSPIQRLKIEEGRTTPMYEETKDAAPKLLYVRATARAADGFQVEITPCSNIQNK